MLLHQKVTIFNADLTHERLKITTLLPLHPESSNMDLVNWC